MSDVLASISENPILLAVLIFLVGGLAYGLMKRVLQLAAVFVLGFVVVGAWFVYSGEEPPEAMRRIADGAKAGVERGAEISKEKAREVGEKLGDELERAAREKLGP